MLRNNPSRNSLNILTNIWQLLLKLQCKPCTSSTGSRYRCAPLTADNLRAQRTPREANLDQWNSYWQSWVSAVTGLTEQEMLVPYT
jgi:hypothetical protein